MTPRDQPAVREGAAFGATAPTPRRTGRPFALRSLAALTFVVALLTSGNGAGQEAQPAPPDQAPARPEAVAAPPLTGEEAPEPIPLSLVADRADALARRLRNVRDLSVPEAEIEAIAERLEERTPLLAMQRDQTVEFLASQPGLAPIAELDRDWSRAGVELSGWRRSLTRRAAELESETTQLKQAAAVWDATLESLSDSEAPPEVMAAVELSAAEIKAVRKATSKRRSAVLALQNRVSQQELIVAEMQDAVRAAREGFRSRLFEPDAPPLWSAIARSGSPPMHDIEAVFVSSRSSVGTFLDARRPRLLSLSLLFLVAWASAFSLKRSIDARRAAGAKIEQTARVFQRPFAVALLLALLSVFWLFPLAPEALLDLVGLLLLLPLLRLLPLVMHPGFRPILYGLAAFYLVDSLRDLFEGAPLVGRVTLALESAAAALCCLGFLRPQRLAHIPDSAHFPRWPARALRFGLVIFSVALVANLLGYFSLGRLLCEGVLTSLYIGTGLYAGAQVLGVVLDVTTKTAWAQRINMLRSRRSDAVRWIRRGIGLVASGLWVYWTLGFLVLQDAVIGGAILWLTTPLELGAATLSIADLLTFAGAIAAAIVSARVVRFVLMEDVFPRVRTGRGIPHAVSATAYYVILFAGFLFAIAAAGIDLGKFTLLAGAFGVGIGFGLQNVVNNFISGIILLYERPIQVGDTIDMGDLMGQVKRIGIRSSTLRTYSGSEVIVPNGDLISQRVINWTLSDRSRRIEIPIGVKYGSDPLAVLAILRGVADAHPRVSKVPPPSAYFRRHGESSLDFELRVWIANFDDWFVAESELNCAINRALADAGIEIPFPQRDLHLRSVDAQAARQLGSDDR